MAATKDERTGAIKTAHQREDMAPARCREQGQAEQEYEEESQGKKRDRARDAYAKWHRLIYCRSANPAPTDESTGCNRAYLPRCRGYEECKERRSYRDARTLTVRA